MDENNFSNVNCKAKVHDFINQDNKEWNLHSIASLLPSNVITGIKAILIPSSPTKNRIFWGFSQDYRFTLK